MWKSKRRRADRQISSYMREIRFSATWGQSEQARPHCVHNYYGETYSALLQLPDVFSGQADGRSRREPLPSSNLRRSLAPTWAGQDVARQATSTTR